MSARRWCCREAIRASVLLPRRGLTGIFDVSLRPLLHARLAFDRPPQNDLDNEGQELPNATLIVGGGAEYFFSPHFSMVGRMGAGVGVQFGLGANNPGGGVITMSLVTPAIGAAWYF
jgi:hypothetical protein